MALRIKSKSFELNGEHNKVRLAALVTIAIFVAFNGKIVCAELLQ